MNLTPETCAEGELVLEQSSELDEEVDVGVMETELLVPVTETTIITSMQFRADARQGNKSHLKILWFYLKFWVFFFVSGSLLSSWRAAEVPTW